MSYTIRPATPADEPFLWQMLYHAARMAQDGAPSAEAARADPYLSVYVAGWGRPGDLGFLAVEPEERAIGAAWVRLIPGGEDEGHTGGHTIPELAVAVLPEYIGRGVGTRLLEQLLAAARGLFPAISLSVREDNPAVRLYERLGFVVAGEMINRIGGRSFMMRADLINTSHTPSLSHTPPYDLHCEWGGQGVVQLAAVSDALVIVDVLSFCTCVAIAAANGAAVYPYRYRDASAAAYAAAHNALLAGARGDGYGLSPASLLGIPAGTRLVLPSPNGATLSLAGGSTPTFAGCLRNAAAVARAAARCGKRIGIIPAGERWPDGSLRPALEDLIGAGAIIHHLPGARSPEAEVAEQAFLAARERLDALLAGCASGRYRHDNGFARDVELAAALDANDCAPLLHNGAYLSIVNRKS
jgi:2-phosphosulfolactate phosphatase